MLSGLGLAALGALVLGPNIWRGGFVAEDWMRRALAGKSPDFFGAFDLFGNYFGLAHRPVYRVYVAFSQAAFGDDPGPGLALTILFGVLMAWVLYLLLRELRMEPLHAGVISVLALLFPASSASKLWISGGEYSLAIALGLLGLLAALRAFRAHGRRRVALHGLSVALYLASIGTVEVTAAAILGCGFLYLIRAPRSAALRRWAVDVAACLAFLLLVTRGIDERQSAPWLALADPGDWAGHAETIAREGLGLFGQKGLPLGLSAGPAALLVLVVLAVAVATISRLDRANPVRAELRRWLGIATAGIALCIAGYVVFIPGHEFYSPSAPGVGNRVNAVAAIGMVVLAYSLIVLAVLVAVRRSSEWRRHARRLSAGLGILLAISYAIGLRGHRSDYADAASAREDALARIQEKVPPLNPGSVVFTFGVRNYEAPGIPVFAGEWDLTSALRVKWERIGFIAFPQFADAVIACGPGSIVATNTVVSPIKPVGVPGERVPTIPISYAAGVFFFDVPKQRLTKVTDARACRRAAMAAGASIAP